MLKHHNYFFPPKKTEFFLKDIAKFLIIFVIIFCGFMFGLNNLFWYYKESVRGKVEMIDHLESGELPAEKYFGT